MYWIELIFVDPLIGIVLGWVALMAALSLINSAVVLFTVFKSEISASAKVAAIVAHSSSLLLFSVVLVGGVYGLKEARLLGSWSNIGVSAFFALYLFDQKAAEFVSKIKKNWRNCMVTGSVERDIFERKNKSRRTALLGSRNSEVGGEQCGHDDSGYPVTAEKSSPQTSTQKQEPLSPEEMFWIMGLEQALPKGVWDSLPPVPLTTFTRVLATIPTAGGAHHFAFSPDNHYAFVQNSFINLPEMDDGSVSVIDMN